MEDWSLHAIVRGSSGDFYNNGNSLLGLPGLQHQFDHDFYSSYPELLDMAMDSGDRLEDLYKPFYIVPDQNNQESEKEIFVEDKLNTESDQSSGSVDKFGKYNSTPKYRRRKNQQKKVVIQVSADALSSDKWAWRKYGQKPIKGSPYPRSYYRCSSSKGCLARKLVEQSCTDPGMFIVTYTADHSHSLPTRRNSLSGTVRQKFPSPTVKPQEYPVNINDSSTSLLCFSSNTKQDNDQPVKLEEQSMTTQEYYDDNLMFNDEFFRSFDKFDDFASDMPMNNKTSPQQFSMRHCSGYVN